MTIRRLLVANRGEIATRVLRSARKLGIETVATFSDADRTAPHVLLADHAVRLGPPPAHQSYLDIDKILQAAREVGADGIHPGYGFLAENGDFADAVRDQGIIFVGPDGDTIRKMGSKTQARIFAKSADLPVVPGDNGPGGQGFASAPEAREAAMKLGWPVLIKASGGGGGKGMRRVDEPESFDAAFTSARREASAAFGDATVYLEKALIRPRHIEVQVFADSHGAAVHLGERDCSLQRRHQKLVEETPGPCIDESTRAQMGRAAVAATQACHYLGAGTIEFLLDAEGRFYFLEMNTRLQVEHPVTEMIYGLDLVEWQLRVANGDPLPLDQDHLDARRRGAAIECRICAEDPVHFLPSPGTIEILRVPGGPFVRDDSGVRAGSVVTSDYDPMLSKLVVWGEDRADALARMRTALGEYLVTGVETNLPFHRRLFEHPAFIAGSYDTDFVERQRDQLAPRVPARDPVLVALALHVDRRRQPARATRSTPATSISDWRKLR